MKTIALLTDFGISDYFSGVIKGVILNINPKVNLVDITHNIPPQDVKTAALQLFFSYSYFPKGSIFVLIVDPTVGSSRKIILVKTEKYIFLAPNNGILSYILNSEKTEKIIQVKNKKYFLPKVSGSFQGRDVFAPVAAYLSLNKNLSGFGEEIKKDKLVVFNFPELKKINSFKYLATIIYVDKFGNLLTNIPNNFFKNKKEFVIKIKNIKINTLKQSYFQGKKGEVIAIYGSCGFIEITANLENLSHKLKINTQTKIFLEKLKCKS